MLIPSSHWCRHHQNFSNVFLNYFREGCLFIYLFSSNPFLGVYPLYISGISAVSQQLSSLDLYFFLFNELSDHLVVPSQRWEGKGTIKSFSLAKVLSCFHKECIAPNYTSGYVHENLLKIAGLCMSHKATGAAVEKKNEKECVSCVCLKHLLLVISLNLGAFKVIVLVQFQSPLFPLRSLKVITGRRLSVACSGTMTLHLLSLCFHETCVNLTLWHPCIS